MLFWFGIGVALLLIELASFGLISIWFSVGAFVTMFFSHRTLYTQFYIFSAVSLLALLLIRKIAVKHLKPKTRELDRISGKKVKVKDIRESSNELLYSVYIDGKYWTGISKEILEIDEVVTIEKIIGNKLVLTK